MGLTRILLIAAVAVAGYMVWRRVQRFLDGVEEKKVAKRADGRVLQDLEPCPECGTYVPPGTEHCGRIVRAR